MSTAFRRLPRLVCGAVRARAALAGLRPAVRAPVAASWGEESINMRVGRDRHFFPGAAATACAYLFSALSLHLVFVRFVVYFWSIFVPED